MKFLSTILVLSLLISYAFSQDVNILIMGKAGVGKSSLINFLMGEYVAKVSEYDTGTTSVNRYSATKYGFNFAFYDTPGLGDANYNGPIIEMVRQKLSNINLLLLCFDISAPRLYEDDKLVKQKLVQEFGNAILKHTLVVYTKSNLIRSPSDKFAIVDDSGKHIHNNYLSELAKKRHYQLGFYDVPYVLAYDDFNGPDNWKYDMWMTMMFRGRQSNLSSFSIAKNIVGNQGDGCIDADSIIEVRTDNAIMSKKAKDIIVGDEIFTDFGYSEVYFVYKHKELKQMIGIKTVESQIYLTGNHIIPVERDKEEQYVRADNITMSDGVFTKYMKEKEIIEIAYDYKEAVYILTHNNVVCANNIVVSAHVDCHHVGSSLTYPLRYISHYCRSCVSQHIGIELLKEIYGYFVY